MAIEVKELLKVSKMDVLSDKEFTTGKEIIACAKKGTTIYSCPKRHSSQNNGLYNMEEFLYDRELDNYVCPAGSVLHTNGKVYKKKKHRVKHYQTKQCKYCASVRTICSGW